METLNIFTTRQCEYITNKVIDEINNLRKYDETLSDFAKTELGECTIETFKNGELTCQFKNSIRDKRVYIFGQTGTHEIMELLLMVDAAKRASAGKIIVIIPSYGYARQDKKEGIRGPMGAKLVADLLSVAGIDGLITIDLHADAIQGFFDVPVNHINGSAIFSFNIKDIIGSNKQDYVVCSPDAGGFVRANKFSRKLGLDGAIAINKERDKPGSIASMLLMADVKDKHIVLVDDMCDSGLTLCKAADYLVEEKGAKSVVAVCTHPIFSGNAIEKISTTKNLKTLFVSDTLNFDAKLLNTDAVWSKTGGDVEYNSGKIQTISCSTILAKIIARISKGKSMDIVNNGE